MLLNQYEVMREKYIKGEITNMQWFMFCENCLEELMQENRQVLENLKNM